MKKMKGNTYIYFANLAIVNITKLWFYYLIWCPKDLQFDRFPPRSLRHRKQPSGLPLKSCEIPGIFYIILLRVQWKNFQNGSNVAANKTIYIASF